MDWRQYFERDELEEIYNRIEVGEDVEKCESDDGSDSNPSEDNLS